MGVQIPRRVTIFGSYPAHRKALRVSVSVYAAKKIITASSRLFPPTELLPTGRCRIHFYTVKNPPLPVDAASRQTSSTTRLLVIIRRLKAFGRIMDLLYGTKNGFRAFGYNFAESEPIWIKFETL